MDSLKQEDLKKIRDFYKISKKEIGLILGFGINVWNAYEKKEKSFDRISRSNATLIDLIKNPIIFYQLFIDHSTLLKEALGLGRFYDLRKIALDKKYLFENELRGLERNLIMNFYKQEEQG